MTEWFARGHLQLYKVCETRDGIVFRSFILTNAYSGTIQRLGHVTVTITNLVWMSIAQFVALI
jgi:hypothetical protein